MKLISKLRNSFNDSRWGLCPDCWNEPDEWFNVHKTHFATCSSCKTAWTVGWNLFSDWQYEIEETWQRNSKTLEDAYRPVKPYYPLATILLSRVKNKLICLKSRIEYGHSNPQTDDIPF